MNAETRLKGSVASDILEHINPNPLSGVVYLSSFPYLAATSESNLNTPLALEEGAGITSTDDVPLSKRTAIVVVDSVFAQPEAIPFSVSTSWIGMTTLQPPNQVVFVTTRPQDPTALIAAGKAGLPTLFLHGTDDKIVYGERVLSLLQTLGFVDLTVNWVEGGPHALFYENQTEVVTSLLAFLARVNVSGTSSNTICFTC